MTEPLQFILNDRLIEEQVPPGLLVLDLLREQLRLTGTKEGCREGDCGACVVLVGDLSQEEVRYRAVTSCLMPAHELAGRHLVTIEALRLPELTAVQQAVVDEGASQCGFCTPGIVLSLTGTLMERRQPPDAGAIKTALGGHLCRCTGYRSLKAAVGPLSDSAVGVRALVRAGQLPEWMLEVPARLRALQARNGEAGGDGAAGTRSVIVAGGTDLYVQRGEHIAAAADVQVLGNRPDLRGIEDRGDSLVIGPSTTFEELAESAEFATVAPKIRAWMDDIASVQIRNRATVGGNIVNASPIGDVTILLLALDTTLTLEFQGNTRRVPLREFYLGYKELDLRAGELVTAVEVRKPESGTRVNWEKVSKRRSLDIASVNSTLAVREQDGLVTEAALAFGGVAPVPLLLREASAWLVGRPVSAETVREASLRVQEEIAPITDVRGSAAYKRLLSRQLLWAHFTTLFPERIHLEALYAEH